MELANRTYRIPKKRSVRMLKGIQKGVVTSYTPNARKKSNRVGRSRKRRRLSYRGGRRRRYRRGRRRYGRRRGRSVSERIPLAGLITSKGSASSYVPIMIYQGGRMYRKVYLKNFVMEGSVGPLNMTRTVDGKSVIKNEPGVGRVKREYEKLREASAMELNRQAESPTVFLPGNNEMIGSFESVFLEIITRHPRREPVAQVIRTIRGHIDPSTGVAVFRNGLSKFGHDSSFAHLKPIKLTRGTSVAYRIKKANGTVSTELGHSFELKGQIAAYI